MKKAKKSRLILFALTFALLVCSVFGIASSANTDTEGTGVEIIMQNIVYGDRIQIAFAVDVPLSEAETVEVSYYTVDPSKIAGATLYKATLLDTSKSINLYRDKDSGKSYPVFVTHGIATKDLADYVYAVAHVKDAEIPNPTEYVKTSVAEYLYTRLYYDGYVTKTPDDGKDYNRRRLYELLLEYGAQAQTVLVNDKVTSESKKEKLVTDYIYIYAEGGALDENGRAWGLYEGQTSFNLVAPEGKNGSWSITTYNSDGSVKTQGMGSSEITVNESCKFVFTEGAQISGAKPAVPAGVAVFDFEGAYETEEKTLNNGDKVSDLTFTEGEVSTIVTYTAESGQAPNITYYTNSHKAVAQVIEEEGRKHLNIKSPMRVDSMDRQHIARTNFSYATDDANTYIFELDLKIDSKVDNADSHATPLNLTIHNNIRAGSKSVAKSIKINGEFLEIDQIQIARVDEWFTLRFEYSVDEGDLKLYVKNDHGLYEHRIYFGVCALDGTVGSVDFYSNNNKSAGSNVHIDNVMLYATNVTYVINEKIVPLQ